MEIKKVRIKTEEELGGRPGSWNSDGYMDHLYGTEVEVLDVLLDGRLKIKDPYSHKRDYWFLDDGQYTLIDEEIKVGDRVRVKTEEELGGRPSGWNSDGEMDHLYGLEVEVVGVRPDWAGVRIEDPRYGGTWYLKRGEYTLIKEHERKVTPKKSELGDPPKENGGYWR